MDNLYSFATQQLETAIVYIFAVFCAVKAQSIEYNSTAFTRNVFSINNSNWTFLTRERNTNRIRNVLFNVLPPIDRHRLSMLKKHSALHA